MLVSRQFQRHIGDSEQRPPYCEHEGLQRPPRGDFIAAGAEQIQQVVREVWPGGPDASGGESVARGSCWNTWPGSPDRTGNSAGRPAAWTSGDARSPR